MDLHRSPRKAEWLLVSRQKWNVWQVVASRTKGVVTPANVVTIVGFALVLCGVIAVVAEDYWPGVWLISVGRFCDVLDGWLATKTRTKSPTGEMLDASVDKLETAIVLIVLLGAGVLPWLAALIICVPQVAIALVTLLNAYRHVATPPSLMGKWGMAAAWLGFGGYLIHRAASIQGGVDVWIGLAHVLVGVSFVLSTVALFGYLREYKRPSLPTESIR